MPLHAITEVYGEAGLRDRFGLEIESFPPAEREQLAETLRLVSKLHAEDRRIRAPYVNPLLRVAIRIIRDRNEQYRMHVAESLERDPWARVIKVSDFTDNGVGVIHTTYEKAYKSAGKYRPLVPKLRELVGRPDTPLSIEAKDHILDQLDLAEERFAAILD